MEDDHTYFVGTAGGGTWVHNVTCLGPYKNFDEARREAFEMAGMTNPEDVTVAMEDESGTAIEFEGANGSKINYDQPHEDTNPLDGHDMPHIGVQFPGKRYLEGGDRFNLTYDGPQGPFRP